MTLAEQQIKVAHRTQKEMSLFYADLDDLKKINDAFGHEEGDAALVEAADVLRDAFRDSDIIARLGGDEFAVLAIDVAEGKATALARRLRERIAGPQRPAGRRLSGLLQPGDRPLRPGQALLPRRAPRPRRTQGCTRTRRRRRPPRRPPDDGRRPSVPDPVLGQLVVERRPRDGQDLGRLAQVPLGHLQEIGDVVLLQVARARTGGPGRRRRARPAGGM
ncbi:MAG: GGDEF domain-containing protein [Candidatus Moduliflexus flocculans]|nr:GGDEF domain-containing protein [Candidatus Moduliflexus flocculans]